MRRVIHTHRLVTETTPLSILPRFARYWRPTCAVWCPSLRSPVSSITSTPSDVGAVAGSSRSRLSRSACTWRSSQVDSERNHCSRCARDSCAPTSGSVLASLLTRLLSFGGQKQALHVATKPFTLVALPQQVIKVPGIGFQRLGSWDNIDSLRHLTFLLSPYCITLSPLSTKYRYNATAKKSTKPWSISLL